MIGPVESAFRTALAAMAGDWPVRWPNDAWDGLPDGYTVGDGNMPVDANGVPAPAIEVEVLGGRKTSTAGPSGARIATLPGTLRLYLSVAQGSGGDAITAKVDALSSAFNLKTVLHDPATDRRLQTWDPRVDDDVAGYEEGNRFTRMISIPWDFTYRD